MLPWAFLSVRDVYYSLKMSCSCVCSVSIMNFGSSRRPRRKVPRLHGGIVIGDNNEVMEAHEGEDLHQQPHPPTQSQTHPSMQPLASEADMPGSPMHTAPSMQPSYDASSIQADQQDSQPPPIQPPSTQPPPIQPPRPHPVRLDHVHTAFQNRSRGTTSSNTHYWSQMQRLNGQMLWVGDYDGNPVQVHYVLPTICNVKQILDAKRPLFLAVKFVQFLDQRSVVGWCSDYNACPTSSGICGAFENQTHFNMPKAEYFQHGHQFCGCAKKISWHNGRISGVRTIYELV